MEIYITHVDVELLWDTKISKQHERLFSFVSDSSISTIL